QEKPDRQSQGRGCPHGCKKSRGAAPGGAFGLAGGLPFQEPFASEEQAGESADDSIQADKGVVGQEYEAQNGLAELPAAGTGQRPQMQRKRHFTGFAKEFDGGRQECGESDDREDKHGAGGAEARQQEPIG